MRNNGKITFWHKKKAYGFIEPAGGGDGIFVHISSFVNKDKIPTIDEQVSYNLGKGRDDRPSAVDVLRAGEQEPATQGNSASSNRWLIPACVIGLIVLAGGLTFFFSK